MLSPMLVDPQHPFPHLSNKGVEICVRLRKKKGEEYFAFLPVPVDLPQILYLPGPGVRYIGMEDLLLELADVVFDTYTVEEKIQICITRNADIHAEDEDCEKNEDFRKVMQKLLKDRRRLAPLRLEMTGHPSSKMLKFLQSRLLLSDSQIFYTSGPLQMKYAYGLENKLNPEQKKELLFEPYTPKTPGELAGKESMFDRIRKQDRLLSYPYESMKPFLRLLEEAASDPDVRSIQITIYRLAGKSKLVKYLCRAAENGKKVTVLIELRARFDEQNNIDWSKEFEKSGCTIMYGMANFKVHSKLCLITRNERGTLRRYTQIGTGTYNETTSKLYTDFSLMTADPGIGENAALFFRNMGIGNLEHSRIYVFGKGSTEKMYIASADFMTRNTRRRVEVGCPILDPDVREKIWKVIHLQWSDNTKAMKLLPERKYEPVTGEGSVNSQEEQMKLAEETRRKDCTFIKRIKNMVKVCN